MQKLTKLGSNHSPKEIENVIELIKDNVDCTKDIIYHIDDFIETKRLPTPIKEALITLRNACSINVMNFTKAIQAI